MAIYGQIKSKVFSLQKIGFSVRILLFVVEDENQP